MTTKGVRLQERDKAIIEFQHACGGMLTLNQIDRRFFENRQTTRSRNRMQDLVNAGYLEKVGNEHRRYIPPGEVVYFQTKRGAEVVAGLQGLAIDELEWQGAGRWSLIDHDIHTTYFLLDALEACEQVRSDLELVEFVPEVFFKKNPDVITYRDRRRNKQTRRMWPDLYLRIQQQAPEKPGKKREWLYLVEVDMGTEANLKFGSKVRAGAAYLNSKEYRQRFGHNYGRWLVVTKSGGRRLNNMRRQTVRDGGAGLYYFTTFAEINPQSIFSQPVWYPAEEDDPFVLIPPAGA
jgi:hypothetical protein